MLGDRPLNVVKVARLVQGLLYALLLVVVATGLKLYSTLIDEERTGLSGDGLVQRL